MLLRNSRRASNLSQGLQEARKFLHLLKDTAAISMGDGTVLNQHLASVIFNEVYPVRCSGDRIGPKGRNWGTSREERCLEVSK